MARHITITRSLGAPDRPGAGARPGGDHALPVSGPGPAAAWAGARAARDVACLSRIAQNMAVSRWRAAAVLAMLFASLPLRAMMRPVTARTGLLSAGPKDLDVVTAFFVALGLEVEGRTFVEGEFLDTVCGIPGSRTEIVMLKPPGDGTRLELSSFVRPGSVPGSPAALANELGLRNVAFEVNDLQAAIDWAATEGYGLVGGIGEYEGAWRMA
jgi:catechol 2,3-dioxygenase-like lactoylglutathione lyase family enzyme